MTGETMNETPTPHPWAAFLAARADCIDMLHKDGMTDEEIAGALSMTGGQQVYLIRTRERNAEDIYDIYHDDDRNI